MAGTVEDPGLPLRGTWGQRVRGDREYRGTENTEGQRQCRIRESHRRRRARSVEWIAMGTKWIVADENGPLMDTDATV